MTSYRHHPDRIAALVQDDRVHRDLYLSEEIFALEQERLFANTWVFLGHASQVPEAGDFVTQEVAGRPLLMVRQPDGAVHVMYNRCAHKGTQLVTDESGNTGRFFRCPYHAWTYKLDGAPLGVPLKNGYEGTQLKACESGQGLSVVKHVKVYRDFVFVRLADTGPAFEDYFGEVLGAIDNMVDRSPEGKLTVCGGVLRNIVHCNWKMYLENINDTVHPMSTHESATKAAEALWEGHAPTDPKPMAMEQILPFGSGYEFFDKMGGRVFANGHSVLGRELQHPLQLCAAARIRSRDAGRARRRARGRHPSAIAAELGLLSEPFREGLAAGHPRDPPARCGPHADRGLELPRGRCARAAVRARDELQPARVLADVGGGA
jgi:phenylpropionate dioxygenase-like ring-hydroxylating dioxygenase large terminal subunit